MAGREQRCRFAVALLVAAVGSQARAQLTDLGATVVHDGSGAVGTFEEDDRFGESLAVGDFDDDGFDDLVVGIPGETVNGFPEAGAIHVFYGYAGGLRLTGDQIFTQNTPGITGSDAEEGDQFGFAFAVGDLDNDGIDDLAVGSPYEDVGGVVDAGMIWVLFGSDDGLSANGSVPFNQDTLPASAETESAETNDYFGYALAIEDIQHINQNWLIVGSPGENTGLFEPSAGLIVVVTSDQDGLFSGWFSKKQDDVQCVEGINETNDAFDFFGSSLAAKGTVLYAGVPGEELSVVPANIGTVLLPKALGAETQCYHQDTPGVGDTAEDSDAFGKVLGLRGFNLVVGVPLEDLGALDDAGLFHLFVFPGDDTFDQSDFDAESPEAGDLFGSAFGSGDFDGDGSDDLAIGAPGEDLDATVEAGTVNVLYGDPDSGSLTTAGNQTFNSNFPAGMPDSSNPADRFGAALASGDFDGNGTADLAIGVPGEALGSEASAGEITVLFGLDRESGAFGTAQFGSTTLTVDESAGSNPVFVSRQGGAPVAVTVDHLRGPGGTATLGDDFAYTPGTESWGVGDVIPNTVGLGIVQDTLDEPDETIVLKLNDPSPGLALGSPSTLTITIADDDIAGSLQFSASIYVVNEKLGSFTVQVRRTGGAASGVTVHYATQNGTATAGSDYTAVSGTLSFAAGDNVESFEVPILDNPGTEGDEFLLLQLSNPGGGGVLGSPAAASLTILEDTIFADDWESGDNDAWDVTAIGGASTLEVLPEARYAGALGLRVHLAGGTAHVHDQVETPMAEYHARFYLRPWTLSLADGEGFELMSAFNESGAPAFKIVVVPFDVEDVSRALIPLVFLDNGAVIQGGLVPVPDGRRGFEVDWRAAVSPAIHNGSFTGRLDGATVFSVGSLDNDARRIDAVELGAVAGVAAGSGGFLDLDEFFSTGHSPPGLLSAFDDVSLGDETWAPVHAVYNAEASAGCAVGAYCPDGPVTRQQLALQLLKANDGADFSAPDCAAAPFSDVLVSSPFCRFIQTLKTRGLTAGCAPAANRFCPLGLVSRRQAAVLLLTTLEGAGYQPGDCVEKPFTDVEIEDSACTFIQEMEARGITQGCADDRFCPDQPLSREQLAVFLQRTFGLVLPVAP